MRHRVIPSPQEEALWSAVTALEGQPFFTARGLEYTFRVLRSREGAPLGELLFERKKKTVTRATLFLAYRHAVAVQKREGCVSGPKKLGVFGASYLYPIFLSLGVCTRSRGVENMTLWNEEETTMARPKGSKNKKKLSAGANLDELIAQRLEARAALEAERDEIAAVVAENAAKLRAVKYQIKKLDKEVAGYEADKAAAEAAAAAAAAKEAVQAKVDELLASGKSLDEIMGLLG